MDASNGEITQRLKDWRQGDRRALDEIMPWVYDDLKNIARRYMVRERDGHTLQATALVNEAFLKLREHSQIDWHSRAHFLATAATFMRRILVDHARQKAALKRGRGWKIVPLEQALDMAIDDASQVLALDEALIRLEALDPEQGRLVELRYFGGLSVSETAQVLGVTGRTVKRRWRTARMWLFQYLVGGVDAEA